MKRFTIVFCVIAIVLGLSSLAVAEPTASGPTGLFLSPTADITTPESAWLGATYSEYSNGGIDDTIWTYTLTAGISEVFELGAAGFYHSESDDGFGINGKYALMLETEEMPGISLGLNYMDLGGNTMTQIYFAGTKYFQGDDLAVDRTVAIHAGGGWVDADWVDEDFNYWAGFDFNIGEDIIGIVEYVSTYGQHDEDAFAFGIRYFANDQWTAQIGMIDSDMTFGASFIF